MTKQEAIERLKSFERVSVEFQDGTVDMEDTHCLRGAIRIAIECIEKQIHKKPNWQGDKMCMDAYCPNCGAYLDDGENPCDECHISSKLYAHPSGKKLCAKCWNKEEDDLK